MNTQLRKLVSVADFQDGASSPNKRGSFSLSMLLKGDKDTLHQEKSMNGVRQFLGLYRNFELADDILSGATKREEAFKKSGAKQLNHVRGTDGWFRSMFVLEVRQTGTKTLIRTKCTLVLYLFRSGLLTTILISGYW